MGLAGIAGEETIVAGGVLPPFLLRALRDLRGESSGRGPRPLQLLRGGVSRPRVALSRRAPLQ